MAKDGDPLLQSPRRTYVLRTDPNGQADPPQAVGVANGNYLPLRHGGEKQRRSGGSCLTRLIMAGLLVALLAGTLWVVYDASAGASGAASGGGPGGGGGGKAFTLDDVFSGEFAVKRAATAWVRGDAAGRLTYRSNAGDVFMLDPTAGQGGSVSPSLLLNATTAGRAVAAHGHGGCGGGCGGEVGLGSPVRARVRSARRPGHYESDLLGHSHSHSHSGAAVVPGPAAGALDTSVYTVSPDARTMLVAVNRTKRWRHSFEAEYLLLRNVGQAGAAEAVSIGLEISHAEFLSNTSLVFVQGNNVQFIADLATSMTPVALTEDGSPNVFNGIPDWLYEEEILSSRSAIIAPRVALEPGKADEFCFFSFDNTGVGSGLTTVLVTVRGRVAERFVIPRAALLPAPWSSAGERTCCSTTHAHTPLCAILAKNSV